MKVIKYVLGVMAVAAISATVEVVVSRELKKYFDKKDSKKTRSSNYSNLH